MIKIAVVDDHNLVRESISLYLNTLRGIAVEIEAENGQVLLSKLEEQAVDIVLLDIQMPILDGYQTCKAIIAKYPDIKVIMMSFIATIESIHTSLNAGAHGYFSKNGDLNELEKALNTIQERGFYFEAGLAGLIHKAILWDKTKPGKNDGLAFLSQREIMIVKLICNGYTNAEIGDKLSINIRTVESHRNKIIEKSGAKNFTSVILMAIKYNYIGVEDLLINA